MKLVNIWFKGQMYEFNDSSFLAAFAPSLSSERAAEWSQEIRWCYNKKTSTTYKNAHTPTPADTNLLIGFLREVNVYILSCATEPCMLP